MIHFPAGGARLDAAPTELPLYRGGWRDYRDLAPTEHVSCPAKCPNSIPGAEAGLKPWAVLFSPFGRWIAADPVR